MTGVISFIQGGRVKKINRNSTPSGVVCSISFEDDTTVMMKAEDADRLRYLLNREMGKTGPGAIPIDIEYHGLKLEVYVERGMAPLPYGGARPDGTVAVVAVIDDKGRDILSLIEAIDPSAIVKFEDEASEYIESRRAMRNEGRKGEHE